MIGVYGGTFNPVHFGHLRTALEVREQFGLDELRLIPCRLPPHRCQPSVSAADRLAMLQLACADIDGFVVDGRELAREGPSYTVDTLVSLRQEYPQTPLLLFMGQDAFEGLMRWHRWQHLFDHAHVVVMTRPGYQCLALPTFLQVRLTQEPSALNVHNAGKLFFTTVTALAISATAIRAMIAEQRNPKFLLPDAVIAYIHQHRLYFSSDTGF
ncbi:MAG: nicotinate-nucleotide adenylyltransferase [Methylomonas sp.]|nr:nicotinate-nucleotide adenylyltransferase [Methylomonas sp.]PPD22449.1 MAG: nicotinic acid mononucleotide adenylyltransferase [Methylomonas sp.]PPD26887.1 MAG: nicotinic acid mononucleotide adenylyltransferase [Methylomonas sp.]PPD37672.1 MAG: nicotinic acid mononucleotide adenylyltransferase [Methylomonas sp.]PPD38781.1 MAG: nicotinic acid mononucleotide adenylyltransferase [Methylomonas sp.]